MSSTVAPDRALLAGATSAHLVGTMALDRGAAPKTTSYTLGEWALSRPKPEVALPWGSKSHTRILAPWAVRAAARLTQDVVFPTPPFWLTMAMVLPMGGSPLIRRAAPVFPAGGR